MMKLNLIPYRGGKAAYLANRLYAQLGNEKILPANMPVSEWVQKHMLPTTLKRGKLDAQNSTKFLDWVVNELVGTNARCSDVGVILLEMTRDPKYIGAGACPVCDPEGVEKVIKEFEGNISKQGYIPQVVVLDNEGNWGDSWVIGVSGKSLDTPYLNLSDIPKDLRRGMPGLAVQVRTAQLHEENEIKYPLKYLNTEYDTTIQIGKVAYNVGLGHRGRMRSTEQEKRQVKPVDAILIYANTQNQGER